VPSARVNRRLPSETAEQASGLPAASGGQASSSRSADEPSRVDAVYEQILLEIVRGNLRGGTELKSTLLAQQLGVSRTPVVQALQRLAADGIVSLELNKRAVVRPGAENWLVELHELRELLEPTAAARAAQQITAEDLQRLDELAQEARPHSRPDWLVAAQRFDFAMHLMIAERSGNFALTESIRKIWRFKRISYLAAPEPEETIEQGYGEHLSILAALRSHDSETARAAMLFHLRSAAASRVSQTIV
jgi:DNA-binding GntR family transcriptional regulator